MNKLFQDNIKAVYVAYNHISFPYIKERYKEELIQEGLIGLDSACKHYTPNNNCSFFSFAVLCAKRRMMRFIQLLNKHQEFCISLDEYVLDNDSDLQGPRQYEADIENIHDIIERYVKLYMHKYSHTSTHKDTEKRVRTILYMLYEGYTYQEIGKVLGITKQRVNNYIDKLREMLKGEV